jgi:hypothetical protein
MTAITFSPEQLEVMNELASYIKFKNIVIEYANDLKKAFSDYLQSNATNYFFKCDEFEKENFTKQLKN